MATPTAPALSPSAKAITDKGASAIHIDTDVDGLNTTSIKDGIKFDIFGNGTPINTGWGNDNDGLLVLDRNGNGKIDDANELFGGGIGQGFAKLAALDANKDGIIDSKDTDFSKLQIWTDLNQDGKTDPGELKSLKDSGIASLNLTYTNDFKTINAGNLYGETSTAKTTDGKTLDLVEVYYPTKETNPALTPTPVAPVASATPIAPVAPAAPSPADVTPQQLQKTIGDLRSAVDIPGLKDSIGKEIARLENLAGVGNIPKFHGNPLMGTINPFNGANDNPLMGHEFQISSDIFANFKTFGKA